MYVGYMSYMGYVIHIIIFMNCLKSLLLFLNNFGIFLLIYEDGKPKL